MRTLEEIEYIKKLYLDGNTQRDIEKITGWGRTTFSKHLKGIRSRSQAAVLSISKGRRSLSDMGRKKLSDNGDENT
jgi:transposase